MRVLSVDGGGVRGAVPVVILARLERYLGRPLRRHFDLVAGTSTGALVAAAVAAEVPMAELVVRWPALAREVFAGPGPIAVLRSILREGPSRPAYDPAPLAAAVERLVGRRAIGSLSAATMLFAYDVEAARPWVAKSWHPSFRDLALTDVLLASCAARGYFPGRVVAGRPLIDGGFAANNPAMCALAEAARVEGGCAARLRMLSRRRRRVGDARVSAARRQRRYRVRAPAAGGRSLRRRITRFPAPEQGPASGGLLGQAALKRRPRCSEEQP